MTEDVSLLLIKDGLRFEVGFSSDGRSFSRDDLKGYIGGHDEPGEIARLMKVERVINVRVIEKTHLEHILEESVSGPKPFTALFEELESKGVVSNYKAVVPMSSVPSQQINGNPHPARNRVLEANASSIQNNNEISEKVLEKSPFSFKEFLKRIVD